jgi:hypothetical protein
MLYSYKMTDDAGFAPNPFFRVLTLATCKPFIRSSKKVGNLIAGFTSQKLCNDPVGHERLVYIMKISEILTFDSYFKDSRFQCKKSTADNPISLRGDNIYFSSDQGYCQASVFFHRKETEKLNDLKSDQVLVSHDFFYFGCGAIPLDKFKIHIPRTQTRHGVRTDDEKEILRLWNYLNDNYKKNRIINPPHGFQSLIPDSTESTGCSGKN